MRGRLSGCRIALLFGVTATLLLVCGWRWGLAQSEVLEQEQNRLVQRLFEAERTIEDTRAGVPPDHELSWILQKLITEVEERGIQIGEAQLLPAEETAAAGMKRVKVQFKFSGLHDQVWQAFAELQKEWNGRLEVERIDVNLGSELPARTTVIVGLYFR